MKKYIIAILILATAGSGCKKTFLSELAVNPNTPAVATPALLLAGALKTTADLVAPGSSRVTRLTIYGFYSGYLSWSTGTQPDQAVYQYIYTTSTFDFFTPIYANLASYDNIIKSTTDPYYTAIAKIMKVYMFQTLVDNYNDVPYSQALQGATNLTPVYDSGSSIYDDLMKQLDAAIVLITNAPATVNAPGTSDIVYGANKTTEMGNWKIFANTLKLKLAIRQSNVAAKAAALKTAVQATAAIGYINVAVPTNTSGNLVVGAEANVQPGYANINGQQSPIDQAVGFTQTGGVSGSGATYFANSYYVNKLIGAGTPYAPDDVRLFQVYAQSTSATTAPIVNAAVGKIEATALGQTAPPQELNNAGTALVGVNQSKYSAFILNPVKSSPIFTAAESLFLQAEAAKSGLITGIPATLYNAGVTASFIDFGLTATAATTYLAKPAYAYPAAGSDDVQESAIIYQKWVALNPANYFEAFNEYRRTGYPDLPRSIFPAATGTTQPARIPYPLTEYNTNAANVAKAGVADTFTGRIFWAKP
ncbi:SusD/RagB family nutrient-binding outer membrane lipoprotein [Mucilaginibacter sp.]|uniref:SusD/RagB family nutrient-binding outer membrane lipoprotein n=1 Tax=Mucilaginibacter sp. TaxID=1882438 RepID=UPI00261C4D7C|nr:SusD/RagB family nutrient-binding outer membrane lipoprotein [Mucilaginibacter sp.]MDB4927504.1 Starch-binding associating with outer rane [Mucilaginibacter sp.]